MTHGKFLDDLDEVKEYFVKRFPDTKIDWDSIEKDFSAKEFLDVRAEMFSNFRFFVKKVTSTDITIF